MADNKKTVREALSFDCKTYMTAAMWRKRGEKAIQSLDKLIDADALIDRLEAQRKTYSMDGTDQALRERTNAAIDLLKITVEELRDE